METILVLVHTEADGGLAKSAREAVASACALAEGLGGAPVLVGLVGAIVQPAADSLAGCGASRFLAATDPEFSQSRYASDALAAEQVCRQAGATLVLAPGTSRWARVLPGVAHRLGGRADAHVTGLQVSEGVILAGRWLYRQRIETLLRRTHRPWVILLDPGCVSPWEGTSGSAVVEPVAVAVPAGAVRTSVAGLQAPPAEEQTIRPDAEILFVAGAGWTKAQPDGPARPAEAAALILGFLRRAQASLGGSKSLVDISGEGQAVLPFMTHLNQIGQTGSTPRHAKGLATCCHGEEPHTVGWRFITERRAVNLDPNCGWSRGKADVLYVADAFGVMRKVNELLQ
jgi:electron transfer flavoprotein alpha subunit